MAATQNYLQRSLPGITEQAMLAGIRSRSKTLELIELMEREETGLLFYPAKMENKASLVHNITN